MKKMKNHSTPLLVTVECRGKEIDQKNECN